LEGGMQMDGEAEVEAPEAEVLHIIIFSDHSESRMPTREAVVLLGLRLTMCLPLDHGEQIEPVLGAGITWVTEKWAAGTGTRPGALGERLNRVDCWYLAALLHLGM